MIRWYDIGVNLFSSSFRDPFQIYEDSRNAGVLCILTGSDMEENRKIKAFTQEHKAYGTMGIHPHNADGARLADLEWMEKEIGDSDHIIAVGECGLDYDRMFSTRENQVFCLEKHIEIAERVHKPMFLHERCAIEDFVRIFSEHPEVCRRSVVHCFTEGPDVLERLLSMGFMIGITGWICDDRRAGELREAVKLLPLQRVMIETDAPYLTPKNVPGLKRTNVPANIQYVAETLAEYMGIAADELEKHAKANTERFFGLNDE